MSYDMDGDKMVQVLRIGREKMSDKGTTSAAKRVDPLRSQTGLPRAEIIERLKQTFTGLYGATEGHDRGRARDRRAAGHLQVRHGGVAAPRPDLSSTRISGCGAASSWLQQT
nr:hypothetical protein GCM10025699_77730 [Microbacterium flavescens]